MNDLLTIEEKGIYPSYTPAMDQYFVHSHMYEDWGFKELYEHTHHEMEEETEHAARLIRRILFLEGVSDLARRDPLKIGKDVPGMLKLVNSQKTRVFYSQFQEARIVLLILSKTRNMSFGSRVEPPGYSPINQCL